MATIVYGTSDIPSAQVTVIGGASVRVAIGDGTSMVMVGGMDTANGNSSPNTVERINVEQDAIDAFGENSELARNLPVALQNGAFPLYGVAVSETEDTESIASGTTITLSNTPIMDPNVHPDESITVTDTDASQDLTTNVVYEDPVTQPTETDTAAVNPYTGEVQVDASGNYDVTYTYGDYDSALTEAFDEDTPYLNLLSASTSVINSAATTALAEAQSFDSFTRVVADIQPFADPTSPDTANYSDSIDDQRVVLVGGSRAYTDDAETEEVHTSAAVASEMASLPLGVSSTNNSLGGLTGLRTDLTNAQAGELIDQQVTPVVTQGGTPTVAADYTTSTDPSFERAYKADIADEFTESIYLISREYVGEAQTTSERASLESDIIDVLQDGVNNTPKLLDGYTISVEQNDTDPNKTDVDAAIDPVNVMDSVDVTLTVGDIIEL